MATWRGSCLSRAVLLACLALGLFSKYLCRGEHSSFGSELGVHDVHAMDIMNSDLQGWHVHGLATAFPMPEMLIRGVAKGGGKGAMAPPWSPKGPPSRCQKYGEGHNKGSVSIIKYTKKNMRIRPCH